MPNGSQPLAYGSILSGALLLIAAVTGSTIPSVAKGKPDRSKATPPVGGEAAAGGSASAGVSGSTGPTGATIGAQRKFGDTLAHATGLDRGVVEKWLLAEQPPGSPSKPGSNNWLNVQFTDAGPNGEYWRIARLSPEAAALATASWIARNQPSILRASRRSAAEQEAAIVHSGWASSHYGGGL